MRLKKNLQQLCLTKKFIALIALTFLSIQSEASTPIALSDAELWGIENILNAESYAIIANGKANIIDTPDITKIDDLYDKFYKNEIAILKAYKGKSRLISLRVGRVAIEQNKPVVYGAWSSPKIRYEFDNTSTDALAKVGPGSPLAATCTLKSISMMELEFINCKDSQHYIEAHITTRRTEILEYLKGKPSSRQTANQALNLLSLINSKPHYNPCLQPPTPQFTCFSNVEYEGKSLITPEVRTETLYRLRTNGLLP